MSFMKSVQRIHYENLRKQQIYPADDGFKEYLNNKIIHNQRISTPIFMHIYLKIPQEFQKDRFIMNRETNYLMIININTVKEYA